MRVICMMCVCPAQAATAHPDTNSAASLRAKYLATQADTTQAVSVGKKDHQPVGQAYRVEFTYRVTTIGRDKVRFTNAGPPSRGEPDYAGGVLGVVERNTMRYYRAIDVYLAAVSAAPEQQLEQRLPSWFSATEFYPRQLHEVDRATYLDMKRREHLRQQTARSSLPVACGGTFQAA